MFGTDRTLRMPDPVMGAEDSSYVLDQVPGAMLFLGATPTERDPRHSAPEPLAHVFFDESAMATGIANLRGHRPRAGFAG